MLPSTVSIIGTTLWRLIVSKLPPVTHSLVDSVFAGKRYVRRKVANLALNALEASLQRSSLISYPIYMVIDPTNHCNLRCALCPTWQDTQGRPKGMMVLDAYKRLLDEVGPYVFGVYLCNWGEPLLNRHLAEMIRYAKGYNTIVGFSTNLNRLNDNTAKDIVASGVDLIVLSIDGATQDSYGQYRVGGNFSTVMANIERLLSFREASKPFPQLIWQFLVNRYNEGEVEAAGQIARGYGIAFSPSPLRTHMGKELLMPLYARLNEDASWLPQDNSYSRYAYEIAPGTRTRQHSCKWLWDASVVNWDGSVAPCCGVYEKSWDFDNCFGARGTFRRVWNSPQYQHARRLVRAYTKRMPSMLPLHKRCKDAGIICANCVEYGFLED
ncbi:MAG: radical SAM protein [Nitrospirae bacterium]|uniref:radical SAM protein n=1 Tax=Candidatus Magnetobacterium casense TaxID=1455061 RepID=UPI0009DDE4CF|nr:radical SAM protein [Candidatus Magnetobacterium casensis]MBF0337466.1 radical SAM protein [Nitrospirota bacterium]